MPKNKIDIDCIDILSINSTDPEIWDLKKRCGLKSKSIDITTGKENENPSELIGSTTKSVFVDVIKGVIGALIIAAALLLVDPIKALIDYFIVGVDEWVSSLITFLILIVFAIIISILLVIFERRTKK